MVHQSAWDRMTVDEKLEQVRLHQVAQDAILGTLMQALERLGVSFTGGAEPDPEEGR